MLSVVFYLCALLLTSCFHRSRLEEALEEAGPNRPELEKVLSHYQDSGLKLEAARFLIENMPGKYGIVARNANDGYKQFLKDIPATDPVSWEAGLSVVALQLDSISRKTVPVTCKAEDLKTVRADFLIRHIDEAFRTWSGSKFAGYYPFDDFCRYILPYRIAHEPLSDWMTAGNRRYRHLLDSAFTPKEIATRIAMDEGMRYNIGMEKYPYPQSFEEMMHSRWGTCEEMASYLALALRSVGIPASVDYVPAWANRSAGHCWNVVKDTCGRFVETGYDPDGTNRVVYKVSKIYRRQFARNANADVTGEYGMPQTDLTFRLTEETGEVPVSLCTFNNRDWTTVAFARADGMKVTFPAVGRGVLWGENKVREYVDVGKGLVYLARRTDNGKPVSLPVVLEEDGTHRMLQADKGRSERVVVRRKYPFNAANLPKTHDSNSVFPGDVYELFYWDNGWTGMGRQHADTDSLVFEGVPAGALLWLHDYSGGREERIFTYENGRQIWW